MEDTTKPTKSERRMERIRKGKAWVSTYEGSHVILDYSKQFQVDYLCALDDLSKIGTLSPEESNIMKQAELKRREERRQKREKRRLQAFYGSFPATDSPFCCVMGYTSGGAPYGVTWEDMGSVSWGTLNESG